MLLLVSLFLLSNIPEMKLSPVLCGTAAGELFEDSGEVTGIAITQGKGYL